MSARSWLKDLGRLLTERGQVVAILTYAAAVVLGFVHQVLYFQPLGFPILQLAAIEDFLLVGLRFLLLLPVLGVVAAIIVMALALLLVVLALILVVAARLLIVSLRVLFATLISIMGLLQILAVVLTLGTAFLMQYVLSRLWSTLYVGVLYATFWIAAGCLIVVGSGQAANGQLEKAHSIGDRSRARRERDDKARQRREHMLNGLIREIERKRSGRMEWLRNAWKWRKVGAAAREGASEEGATKKVTKEVGHTEMIGLRVVVLMLFMLVPALVVTMGLSNVAVVARSYGQERLDDYLWPLVAGPTSLVGDWVWERAPTWLRPYAEVDLRLKGSEGEAREVLQIGATSDYLLFWKRSCTDSDSGPFGDGEPMIVPKGDVARIFPREPTGARDPDCDENGLSEEVCSREKIHWLDETILFAFDSADLDGHEQETAVRRIAARIRKHGSLDKGEVAVVVEAGADPRGRYLYNRDLAERRADAVQNKLQRAGIPARVVAVHGELVSYGEELRRAEQELRVARVGLCTLPGRGERDGS